MPPTVPGIPTRHSSPAQSVSHGSLHEGVPILSRCDVKNELVGVALFLDSLQRDVKNETIESCIRNEQIAATAKDEQRHAFFARPRCCRRNVVFASGLSEPPRGPPDTKGRERRKRLILFYVHSYSGYTGDFR